MCYALSQQHAGAHRGSWVTSRRYIGATKDGDTSRYRAATSVPCTQDCRHLACSERAKGVTRSVWKRRGNFGRPYRVWHPGRGLRQDTACRSACGELRYRGHEARRARRRLGEVDAEGRPVHAGENSGPQWSSRDTAGRSAVPRPGAGSIAICGASSTPARRAMEGKSEPPTHAGHIPGAVNILQAQKTGRRCHLPTDTLGASRRGLDGRRRDQVLMYAVGRQRLPQPPGDGNDGMTGASLIGSGPSGAAIISGGRTGPAVGGEWRRQGTRKLQDWARRCRCWRMRRRESTRPPRPPGDRHGRGP